MTQKIPRSYAEARELADDARTRAFARIDVLTLREKQHRAHLETLPKRARPEVMPPLDVAVNRRVDSDPVFKAAVADNRWYIDYATMYGQGEIMALLCDIIERLPAPRSEMRTRRDGDVSTLKPHPHRPRADRA
jgi:hypothetical protein